jgi:hypothetical protein
MAFPLTIRLFDVRRLSSLTLSALTIQRAHRDPPRRDCRGRDGRCRGRAFRQALLVVLLVLAGEGCTHLRLRPPQPPAAPAVRSLTAVREVLQAADAASAHLLLTEIGRVNVPGFDGPIWRAAYRPFQPDLKRVLIIAGIHGDEPAGVDYILELTQRLSAGASPAPPCDIDILPLVNPWGWVHDQPSSPAGVEIADDFNRFDSHEARAVRRFLREKRYDLVLGLREDPQANGVYLQQYGMRGSQASTRTVDRLRIAGYPIESNPVPFLLKPRSGIVDIPMWSLRVWPLTRQLTIAGYMRRRVSDAVFSIVTPSALALEDRIGMHRVAVEALLAEHIEPASLTGFYPTDAGHGNMIFIEESGGFVSGTRRDGRIR